jgi:hypothetical protein
VEDHDADAEAQGNALFLLDCAVEAFEMAVLQDKSKSDA